MTPIRRDETLYSAAARLSRYVGAKGRNALQLAFFGEDGAVFDEMPTGLARIVASGAFVPIAVADAVREWTLFPYYAHYAEPRRRREAEAVMTGDGGWPHKELGSWTWAAPPPDRLRFCRECHDEMLGTAKEPWWRRTHQLPSTLVCPKHGSMLRVSTVDRATRRRAYVAASAATCPPDAPAVADADDPRVLHDLLWLAGQGDILLNDRNDLHPDQHRESYLQGLAALDLLNKPGEAKLPGIADAMRRYWGSTLDHWPALRRGEGVEQGWLHRLLVGEHGSPPLHHLLLERWLAAVASGR